MTDLLFATHFTVPVTLLATVEEVGAAAFVVVVELPEEEEHPTIATAAINTANAASRFIVWTFP